MRRGRSPRPELTAADLASFVDYRRVRTDPREAEKIGFALWRQDGWAARTAGLCRVHRVGTWPPKAGCLAKRSVCRDSCRNDRLAEHERDTPQCDQPSISQPVIDHLQSTVDFVHKNKFSHSLASWRLGLRSRGKPLPLAAKGFPCRPSFTLPTPSTPERRSWRTDARTLPKRSLRQPS